MNRRDRLTALAALVIAAAPREGLAGNRVYSQNFDDPALVEPFWFSTNDDGKKLVTAADGANEHSGRCLRGNWAQNITDPITHLTSANTGYCRYSGNDVFVDSRGIVDELYIDYWAYVDPNAAKAFGAKWIWYQGTYTVPGEYGHSFNHLLMPPWEGWDTWVFISNNSAVGEAGGGPTRTVRLSTVAGIQAMLRGQTIDQWFQGRWHHFQVLTTLNTPAAASNGVVRFWLDGVLVLDINDYKWRDVDGDHFQWFDTPTMYGGGDPPPGSFGWQLDDLEVWNGLPDSGMPTSDAGSAGSDGGVPDAGSGFDGGLPQADAGHATSDSGATDAGSPSDGGSVESDAGVSSPVDSGVSLADAGLSLEHDAGGQSGPSNVQGSCGCRAEALEANGLTVAFLALAARRRRAPRC